MEKYSLSDIAAIVNRNGMDGFGGNNSWLIILFLIIFGGGGAFGGWGNGAYAAYGANGALTRAEMEAGFNNQTVVRKLDGITQGLCDGFYAQNTNLLKGFGEVSQEIANNRFASQQCCCELKSLIHEENEKTRSMIQQDKIDALRDKVAEQTQLLQTANFQLSQQAQSANLISTLRPFPTPAYITCSPYTSAPISGYGYGCGGCGCGNGYGF